MRHNKRTAEVVFVIELLMIATCGAVVYEIACDFARAEGGADRCRGGNRCFGPRMLHCTPPNGVDEHF
jgi:hypothetical protein